MNRCLRRAALGASIVAALSLAACGGGYDTPAVTFDIGVLINGTALSGVQFVPGTTQTVTIQVGQSIELDANQPVNWTLNVAGSTVTGSGTTVIYGGATITQTAVSPSRIAIDTSASAPLAQPISITLVATSAYDSSLVTTVNVVITN